MVELFAGRDRDGQLRIFTSEDAIKNNGKGYWLPKYNSGTKELATVDRDEFPEVLVILNAAIANRYFDFPKHGKVEAHENFRVIAAGNTLGTGANSDYTGRYCLDRASLDRFALINVDYSQKIENAITENDTDLINFCHAFRKITETSGIQCLFSYRSLERIHKLVQQKEMTLQEIYDISLLKGLDKDDVNIIKAELGKLDDKIKNLTYTKEFLRIPV